MNRLLEVFVCEGCQDIAMVFTDNEGIVCVEQCYCVSQGVNK